LLLANSSEKGLGSVAEQGWPSQELELSGCEGSYVGMVIRQHCEVWQVMTPHAHRMEGGWLVAHLYCSKWKTLKPLFYESHGWKWVKPFSFMVFDPGKLRSPPYERVCIIMFGLQNVEEYTAEASITLGDCGWCYCTEEQLQEVLLKNLVFLYNETISKLVALGDDENISLMVVARNGHCCGGMDVLTYILHNSLSYLNIGSCENDGGSEESELVFTDLRQLQLSRGDVMWCLLMSDLQKLELASLFIWWVRLRCGTMTMCLVGRRCCGNLSR